MPGRQPPLGGPEPRRAVVLTCEHATARAPEGSGLDPAVCASHVGWDPGAVELADALGEALAVPVLAGRWTRLWIDLNRSADHPGVVPALTFGVRIAGNEGLDPAEPARRLEHDWRPFRDETARRVDDGIAGTGRCAHFSVHSFTPELDPAARTYAFGVLFDPDRPAEARLAEAILDGLRQRGWDARANEPYLGVDDGHTTALRRDRPDATYTGLELELNQAFLGEPALRRDIVRAVEAALDRT